MESLFFILLLLVCGGVAPDQIKEYIYVSSSLSWPKAQNYCRNIYNNLSSIANTNEYQRALSVIGVPDLDWTEQNGARLEHWQLFSSGKINNLITQWERRTVLVLFMVNGEMNTVRMFRLSFVIEHWSWWRKRRPGKRLFSTAECTTMTCTLRLQTHSCTCLKWRTFSLKRSVCGRDCDSWMENGSGWTHGHWNTCPHCPHVRLNNTAVELKTLKQASGRTETATRSSVSSATEGEKLRRTHHC